jgi:hypothetical protein
MNDRLNFVLLIFHPNLFICRYIEQKVIIDSDSYEIR